MPIPSQTKQSVTTPKEAGTSVSPCLLSIITPCFNRVDYIAKCVENVAREKCQNLEHIIVDGGSTDGTVEVIKSLAAQHPHIRWISEKDRGQSDAMNKGIVMAQGKLLGFLNTDDYYEMGALRRVISLSHSIQEPALLIGKCIVIDEAGKVSKIYNPSRASFLHFILHDDDFPPNPSAYFYHKSLHEKIGPYAEDLHFVMDYDFLLRAARSSTIYCYPETWGYFLQQPTCKTNVRVLEGHSANDRLEIVARYEKDLFRWERVRYRFGRLCQRNPVLSRICKYAKDPALIFSAHRRIAAKFSTKKNPEGKGAGT